MSVFIDVRALGLLCLFAAAETLSGCVNVDMAVASAQVSCSASVINFDPEEREACSNGTMFAYSTLNGADLEDLLLPWKRQYLIGVAVGKCNEVYAQKANLVGACAQGLRFVEQNLSSSN